MFGGNPQIITYTFSEGFPKSKCLLKAVCVHIQMCGFDTMQVLPDWCSSPQHVAFFACSEGLFGLPICWSALAISGADVSWQPFN